MTVEPDHETTSYAWDARALPQKLIDPEGGILFAHDGVAAAA